MPELPEVQTVIKGLRPLIVDKKITELEVREENLIGYPDISIDELKKRLIGAKIESISRRGKYILINLDIDKILVIHLRMTGKLLVKEAAEFKDKHTHVIFTLDDGQEIRFNNVRKFGRIYLIDPEKPEQAGGLANLGPEPLSEQLSLEDFKKLFANRRGVIKSLLLNQKFIAGIGNIYADEILYLSGIEPERKADSLSEEEKEKIYFNMRDILEKGIIYGGTSFSDYVNAFGEKGSFQAELKVHQRQGEACHICGSKIKKKKIGGRASYYCPKCQD
ncbi:DNA-formamidopyrimidine glycosylase [Halanaerobium sp. Z-7514]|uniref:Formamidopyrimidine-DNA glycosylase n=1 Tax=Halanaerobium polyolivorans TaxID=2886943 RepID=A0AAW4X183_9FIRM|nr:DNA-formamidopyrimidine glycosylase [Halanaerobium polyolivorans]MCC3145558.1 DNA-formamidopyrimidine glycosylase [Halanaerobium polyolivorans]